MTELWPFKIHAKVGYIFNGQTNLKVNQTHIYNCPFYPIKTSKKCTKTAVSQFVFFESVPLPKAYNSGCD